MGPLQSEWQWMWFSESHSPLGGGSHISLCESNPSLATGLLRDLELTAEPHWSVVINGSKTGSPLERLRGGIYSLYIAKHSAWHGVSTQGKLAAATRVVSHNVNKWYPLLFSLEQKLRVQEPGYLDVNPGSVPNYQGPSPNCACNRPPSRWIYGQYPPFRLLVGLKWTTWCIRHTRQGLPQTRSVSCRSSPAASWKRVWERGCVPLDRCPDFVILRNSSEHIQGTMHIHQQAFIRPSLHLKVPRRRPAISPGGGFPFPT